MSTQQAITKDNIIVKDVEYDASASGEGVIYLHLEDGSIDIDLKDVGWLHAPERVTNRLADLIDVNYYRSTDSEIVGFKHKP